MGKKKQRRRLINFNAALKNLRGQEYTVGNKVITLGDLVEGVLQMASQDEKIDRAERRTRIMILERMINRNALTDDDELPYHELELKKSHCDLVIKLVEAQPPAVDQVVIQRIVDLMDGNPGDMLHYDEAEWEDDDDEDAGEESELLAEAAGG